MNTPNSPHNIPAEQLQCFPDHFLDLTMVEEGLDDEDGDLEIPPPDEVPDARAARVEDEAVGDRSLHSMSGTTARDLQSQDSDDYELNPHLLLAYAPAAYQAAVNLVKRFDQHKPVLLQILKGIDRPDSSNATGFQQDIEALNDAMLQLGEDFQNSLVSADHVMETLFKQSLPHMTSKCWRVTELIQLLNLAVIVREVAGGSAETDKMAIKLYMLDAQFPSPFLQNINMLEDSPYIVGNSFLREETFEAALAIRLQSTVLQIHRSFGSEDFDPDKLIQEMFFALPGKAESLRAWDINGLGSGDLGLLPEFDAKMRRWIRRLIGAVKDDEEEIGDGSEEGMQILARNFPWTDFRATVLRWAKLRMEEIRSSIEDSGGIKKLMQQVRAELSKDARFDPEAAIPSPRSPAKKKAKHASTR